MRLSVTSETTPGHATESKRENEYNDSIIKEESLKGRKRVSLKGRKRVSFKCDVVQERGNSHLKPRMPVRRPEAVAIDLPPVQRRLSPDHNFLESSMDTEIKEELASLHESQVALYSFIEALREREDSSKVLRSFSSKMAPPKAPRRRPSI